MSWFARALRPGHGERTSPDVGGCQAGKEEEAGVAAGAAAARRGSRLSLTRVPAMPGKAEAVAARAAMRREDGAMTAELFACRKNGAEKANDYLPVYTYQNMLFLGHQDKQKPRLLARNKEFYHRLGRKEQSEDGITVMLTQSSGREV